MRELFRLKTKRDGAHNYIYDTLNRLVEALKPLPSNPLGSYVYDPVGNRINSNWTGASSVTQANELVEDTPARQQWPLKNW